MSFESYLNKLKPFPTESSLIDTSALCNWAAVLSDQREVYPQPATVALFPAASSPSWEGRASVIGWTFFWPEITGWFSVRTAASYELPPEPLDD
jgi:hypothetical protein